MATRPRNPETTRPAAQPIVRPSRRTIGRGALLSKRSSGYQVWEGAPRFPGRFHFADLTHSRTARQARLPDWRRAILLMPPSAVAAAAAVGRPGRRGRAVR